MRISGVAILLSVLCASICAAQQSENLELLEKTNQKLEELTALPQGIEVIHTPSPVLAQSGSSDKWKYKWSYRTTVSSQAGVVTVNEFGSFYWNGERWVFGNYTEAPFTQQNFAEWYSCPNATMAFGSEFTDPSNWSAAGCLRDGKMLWYFIGTDAKGNRVKGEAVVEQVGRLLKASSRESGDGMTNDEFWTIIDQSQNVECERQAETVRGLLAEMPEDRIASFDQRWRELMAESYCWDLWAVAYIVNGGCADDGFEYFRAWLIGQGKAYYEAALFNAERAADNVEPGVEVECESLMYVAAEAYEAVAGRILPPTDVEYPATPIGEAWEEDDLPQRYPNLSKRFW